MMIFFSNIRPLIFIESGIDKQKRDGRRRNIIIREALVFFSSCELKIKKNHVIVSRENLPV